MHIAYATDQLLPRTATDAEQLMATSSALGRCGATVDLLLPAHAWRSPPTADALARFYEVTPSFTVEPVRGAVPTFRGLEKVMHGVAVARSRSAGVADVLYTRNLPTVHAALRWGHTPVAYETYRPWPDQHLRSAPFFRWMFGHPRLLGAVLHSELAAESYRRIGAANAQLLVAHNGYAPARLEPILSRAQARAQTNLSIDRPTVTYAGHISLDKGLGLVLGMAEALPAVQFVLVGSKGEGPVERRAAAMGNVTVVPWQRFSETVPYLYAADVLLIPPTRGPLDAVGNTVLPMKTFLYMAAGRPVLGPATPDLKEVLTDSVSARLVPPDDLGTATAALRDLLKDANLQRRLADAAQQGVQTWEQRAVGILSFLRVRLRARDV